MVGAAGFEPATWSTQNSRATRLRYTPPGSGGRNHPADAEATDAVHTRFRKEQQCAVAPSLPCPAETGKPSATQSRARDPVAGFDAEFPGRAGDHFKDGPHGSAR